MSSLKNLVISFISYLAFPFLVEKNVKSVEWIYLPSVPTTQVVPYLIGGFAHSEEGHGSK